MYFDVYLQQLKDLILFCPLKIELFRIILAAPSENNN